MPTVALGYKIFDNLGIEISYGQFDQETSLDGVITPGTGTSTTPGVGTILFTQDKWETELRAKQVAIKPVFFLPLGETFTLKASAGLTYNMYETSSRHYTEKQGMFDFDIDVPVQTIPTQTENTVGLIAGVGASVRLYQGLSLGVEANYSYDKVVRATQIFGTLNYQF